MYIIMFYIIIFSGDAHSAKSKIQGMFAPTSPQAPERPLATASNIERHRCLQPSGQGELRHTTTHL